MNSYFDIPYFSNSFFTRVAADLSGKAMPERNARFWDDGKEFEDALLFGKPTKSKVIKKMVKVTKEHSTFQKIFGDPRIKLQHEFYGKFLGLPFKAKADGVIKEIIVPDIKSTSCKTQESFLETIPEYGYDRQMYLYMEVFRCPVGCLIATSKTMDPKVFVVPVEKGSYIWQSGKEKTEHIVSIIKSLY